MEGSGGDDSGAAGDGVVGEAVFGITNDDLLLKEDAEPFGSFFVGFGEGEGAGGNLTAIAGDGKCNGADVGGILGAHEVDDGSALAVDPFAVDGVEGPSAVVDESAGRGDAGLRDFDGIERFNRVETDVGKFRSGFGHGKTIAEIAGMSAARTACSTERARRREIPHFAGSVRNDGFGFPQIVANSPPPKPYTVRSFAGSC